jgi:molybdopterin-guanine dinucleotide biosynthesis protein A
MTRVLGAILAGGRSRRFGSDKANATIGDTNLLDLVARALAQECEEVVVIGRDWPRLPRVDDRPRPGLGPLGGLAGALAHARSAGFDAVLTSACDLPALPPGLVALLAPADALLADQPTVGLWRSEHAARLVRWLEDTERHSIRAWAAYIGARAVPFASTLANINTPADLETYRPLLTRAADAEAPRDDP